MKILYGPPGDSSLTSWFNHLTDDPVAASDTLWLTPTQRKREWVIERFRKNGRMFPPRIHTFDEMARLLDQYLGGQDRELDFIATQFIMLSIVKDPSLSQLVDKWFPSITPGTGFIQEISRQVDELQRHGAGADDIAAIPDASDDIGELFQAIFQRYDTYLLEQGLVDTGTLQLRLAERLRLNRDELARSLPWQRLILDGFLELTPLQLTLLKYLDEVVEIVLVWPGMNEPEGIFGWMIAGLKTTFPDAEWSPLAQWGDVFPLARAAASLSLLSPDALPEDVKPVPANQSDVSKPVPTNQSDVSKPVPDHHLRVIHADTIQHEVQCIAEDIKKRLLVDASFQPRDIAITFPELGSYAPLIRRLFHRYGIPVNISQSLPLTGSPVYIALERLLKLPNQWLRSDVLAVLSDPLLTGWSGKKTRQIVRRLVEWSGQYRIIRGFKQWEDGLSRAMARTPAREMDSDIAATVKATLVKLRTILEDGQTHRNLIQWLIWIRSVLSSLELNQRLETLQRTVINTISGGTDHFEFTRRAYNRLLKFFDSLEQFLVDLKTDHHAVMELPEFRITLPRLLAGVTYQLTTQGGNRVQVLGILGIRGLTFRHVYFGGLTEASFPAVNPISPFWSPELTDVLLERPAHNRRIQAFSDLMRIMSVPAETLTISYPSRRGDETILPSSLWDYILALFSEVGYAEPVPAGRTGIDDSLLSDDPLCDKEKLIQVARNGAGKSIDQSSAAVLREKAISGFRKSGQGAWCGELNNEIEPVAEIVQKKVGPSRTFSPSKLEKYIACPRLFYFDYILRLGEPEVPEDELSPMEKGTFIHKVLDMFYRRRLERGLGKVQASEIDVCAEEIRQIAIEIFDTLGADSPAARSQLLDITGRSELDDSGIATRFARKEAQISLEMQPEHVEWHFGRREGESSVVLKDVFGQPVLLEGKVDRIDSCGDERVIWDYKSGGLPSKKSIDTMDKIQVGIYLIAVEAVFNAEVTAAGYYQIASRSALELKTAMRKDKSRSNEVMEPAGKKSSLNRCWSVEEFDDYIDRVKILIATIAGAMRQGRFPAKTVENDCSRCGYRALCRPEKEVSA